VPVLLSVSAFAARVWLCCWGVWCCGLCGLEVALLVSGVGFGVVEGP